MIHVPVERPAARHVYHVYTVRHPQRDALAKTLADLGVGTAVHYPLPVPDQPMFAGLVRAPGRSGNRRRGVSAASPGGSGERRWPEASRAAREVLSLPCYPELREDEVDDVARAVRQACERL
jgi:dTDP-4-amino-4,6-dideoxygalactose transaminase